MKKNRLKPGFRPEVEMRMTGKETKHGKIAYLYINGKTDRTEFCFNDNLFFGGIQDKQFAKEILKLQCKSIPDNIYLSLSFDKQLLKHNFFGEEEEVAIIKENDVLEVSFNFEEGCDSQYVFTYLNTGRIIERMKKNFSRKNNATVFLEKDDYDFVPITRGKPGETLQVVLNRLVKEVDDEMKKMKNLLLKELMELKRDTEKNRIKWEY